MKRGFLLRAEAKKAAANRRGSQKQIESLAPSTPASEPQPVYQDLESVDIGNQRHLFLGKAPYGSLTEEQKALPKDYVDKSQYQFTASLSDHSNTEFTKGSMVVTTIPQPFPEDETRCQWIVMGPTKAKVLNARGYPARIPKPSRPDMVHVLSTPQMGSGLFAKRNIKSGAVFLTERPLLVAPRALRQMSSGPIPKHYTPQQLQQIVMAEYERFLEYTIGRSSSESQADYRALHNAHTADGSGPLLGIMRSNGYGIGNLYDGPSQSELGKYTAVCKIGSRINHSCVPNVRYYFKLNSFSVQFYAIRDIKAGEQLFYSYCSAGSTRAQRQAELAPYGFLCECPACANATPESDNLRTTYISKTTRLSKIIGLGNPSRAMLGNALRLEEDLVREGLDTGLEFAGLVAAVALGYQKLGKHRESDKYHDRAEALVKCLKDDE